MNLSDYVTPSSEELQSLKDRLYQIVKQFSALEKERTTQEHQTPFSFGCFVFDNYNIAYDDYISHFQSLADSALGELIVQILSGNYQTYPATYTITSHISTILQVNKSHYNYPVTKPLKSKISDVYRITAHKHILLPVIQDCKLVLDDLSKRLAADDRLARSLIPAVPTSARQSRASEILKNANFVNISKYQ